MSQTTSTTAGPLTVVLVHGAFADASSWTGVIERLQKEGVQVTAPANPLRGIASDSAYLANTSKHRKGIHHESKQALARRETPRSGSITH